MQRHISISHKFKISHLPFGAAPGPGPRVPKTKEVFQARGSGKAAGRFSQGHFHETELIITQFMYKRKMYYLFFLQFLHTVSLSPFDPLFSSYGL